MNEQGYISPIIIAFDIVSDIEKGTETAIKTFLERIGVDVNKEELVKALEYDRGQYRAGYQNGYLDGEKKAEKEILGLIHSKCEVCDKEWYKGCMCLEEKIANEIKARYGIEGENEDA